MVTTMAQALLTIQLALHMLDALSMDIQAIITLASVTLRLNLAMATTMAQALRTIQLALRMLDAPSMDTQATTTLASERLRLRLSQATAIIMVPALLTTQLALHMLDAPSMDTQATTILASERRRLNLAMDTMASTNGQVLMDQDIPGRALDAVASVRQMLSQDTATTMAQVLLTIQLALHMLDAPSMDTHMAITIEESLTKEVLLIPTMFKNNDGLIFCHSV